MDSRSLLPLARGETQPERDAVFVERERHANVRKGDLSYPVRGIRTQEFLYLRNLHPERWPAGDPEYYWSVGEFGDVDYTPTKRLLQGGEKDPQLAALFPTRLRQTPGGGALRPVQGPGQVHNVAADPAYAQALAELRRTSGRLDGDHGRPARQGGHRLLGSVRRITSRRRGRKRNSTMNPSVPNRNRSKIMIHNILTALLLALLAALPAAEGKAQPTAHLHANIGCPLPHPLAGHRQ